MCWDLSDHIKTLIIVGASGDAPPERGTLRLQVYEWVGISLAELYERVEKSVKKKLNKPKKAN